MLYPREAPCILMSYIWLIGVEVEECTSISVVLNVKRLGTSTIAGVGLGVLTEWLCSLNSVVDAYFQDG